MKLSHALAKYNDIANGDELDGPDRDITPIEDIFLAAFLPTCYRISSVKDEDGTLKIAAFIATDDCEPEPVVATFRS
ncbi:hypothetical protein RCKICKAPOO_133 [Rhodobacter phage RcKickapoo]|nr:hypothetical protein RCKICKAPOO_133 [Rhodobacter phage RcKickapoo]UUV44503.1 hypothetical protein RCMENCHIE_134 [Rhodobacter phage RcMenchie]